MRRKGKKREREERKRENLCVTTFKIYYNIKLFKAYIPMNYSILFSIFTR